MRFVINLTFALLTITLLSGCSSTQVTAEDVFASAPPDLMIDLTVMTPLRPGEELPAEQNEPHLRPGRFILFADGALHYGIDPQSKQGVHWVPPLVRTLTRQQIAETWSLAQQLGLADPENAGEIRNLRLVQIQRGERAYLLAFHGGNRYWNFIRRGPLEAAPDPAIAEFVQHLAALAWSDQGDEGAKFMPKRYDFGPDPYSRYRK